MTAHSAFTGSIPEVYDRNLGSLLFDEFAKDLAGRIKGKNYLSVLELACGTGIVSQHLKKNLPENSKIFATDLNPDMIKVAQSKKGVSGHEWKIIDMQEITFPDSTFDLVICQFGIMFVPDKAKAYSEIFRVLKPGGVLLFSTWDEMKLNSVAIITHETVNSFFKDNPITFYQTPFSYFNKDEIKKHLQDAGFEDISITVVNKEGLSSSALDAAKGLIEGGPAVMSINERNPELLNVIREKLASVLSEKFGEKNIKCPLQAIVCEGRKPVSR